MKNFQLRIRHVKNLSFQYLTYFKLLFSKTDIFWNLCVRIVHFKKQKNCKTCRSYRWNESERDDFQFISFTELWFVFKKFLFGDWHNVRNIFQSLWVFKRCGSDFDTLKSINSEIDMSKYFNFSIWQTIESKNQKRTFSLESCHHDRMY